jgi:hypothetical protein
MRANVTPAEIIGEQIDDVGFLRSGGVCGCDDCERQHEEEVAATCEQARQEKARQEKAAGEAFHRQRGPRLRAAR